MKTIFMNNAPQEVQIAFEKVKSLFPNVTQVTYDNDCRWNYSDENNIAPEFDTLVDVALLNTAADAVYNIEVPVLYKLYPEKVLAKSEIAGKPTITLTEIGPEFWEVLVVDMYSSTWETLESALHDYADSIKTFQASL